MIRYVYSEIRPPMRYYRKILRCILKKGPLAAIFLSTLALTTSPASVLGSQEFEVDYPVRPYREGSAAQRGRDVVFKGDRVSDNYVAKLHDSILITSNSGRFNATTDSLGYIVKDDTKLLLPVWVLERADRIELKFVGNQQRLSLCYGLNTGCAISIDSSNNAGQIVSAISQGSNTLLEGRFLPRDPGYMLPGNTININLSYITRERRPGESDGGSAIRAQVIESKSMVTAGGTFSLPRLAGATQGLQTEKPVPGLAAVSAGIEANTDLVAYKQTQSGEGSPLWRVERCLNVYMQKKPPQEPAFIKDSIWCKSIGVGGNLYYDNNLRINSLRYQLTPDQRFWRLIDSDGRVHVVPNQYGVSIEETLDREYVRYTGKSLASAGMNVRDSPFATVFPSKFRKEEPFYGSLNEIDRLPGKIANKEQQTPLLNNVTLLPGDTVIVTRRKPSDR